jgi:hypothetical protein
LAGILGHFLIDDALQLSALAPGVNGMMIVIGRDDRSSAAASSPAVAATARTAAKMTDARDI